MLTEQINHKTKHIDRAATLDVVRMINDEDRQVADAVASALPDIAAAVDAITERLQAGGRLIYTGAGTSGRLGIIDAAECVPTFSVSSELIQAVIAGGDEALVHSIEGAEDDRIAGRDDLLALQLSAKDAVLGIAASGQTPYVLAAIEYAKEVGALTVGLSCNTPAALLKLSEIAIAVVVGPEVITGSTRMKAGTAQKMVLNIISTATMIKMGKVYDNLMVDVQVTNNKLAVRARRIISHITGLGEPDAGELLQKSGKQVKTAIVMHKLEIGQKEAQQKLEEAQGYLHEIIGE